MKNSNPWLIPRNHRVEEALEAAMKTEDYNVMKKLLDVLSSPYDYCIEQDDHYTLPNKSKDPYQTFCGT